MPMNQLDHDLHEGIEEVPTSEKTVSRVWLVTFTDLVSLMLTFFVMLFAMSSVKVDEWENVIDSLSRTLDPSPEQSISTVSAKFNISTIFRRRAINLDYLSAVISEAIEEVELLSNSQMMRLEDRLIIALPGDSLFEPGRANMSDRARQSLFVLGGILRNIGNQIGVNGHTDSTPPAGDSFNSNWELSTARAVAVANTLKGAGYTQDIIAFGYSDSRYGQLPDMPDAQRQEMARRVEIVVLPSAGER